MTTSLLPTGLLPLIAFSLLLFACGDTEPAARQASIATPLKQLGTNPVLKNKDLAQGKLSVVNFWASWCVPCRAEHPFLMSLAKTQPRLFGIAYRDKPKNAEGFLRKLGNPFLRLGLDETGYTALGWGIKGIPETFVLDGKGRIIFHHRGPLTDLTEIKKVLRYGTLKRGALKQAPQ